MFLAIAETVRWNYKFFKQNEFKIICLSSRYYSITTCLTEMFELCYFWGARASRRNYPTTV